MILTIEFLERNWKKFNKEYFNDSLKMGTFVITNKKNQLGCYHRYSNIIDISKYYDVEEKDYQQVLIHEMIHQYIRQNNIKDTNKHHGKVFYSIANRINAEGGWDISRCTSREGFRMNERKGETFLVCVYKMGSKPGRYFRFVLNPNKLDYYKKWFAKEKDWFIEPKFFTSTDYKVYSHYAKCHRSVTGTYITKEEYDLVA